jgi:membrane protease YdiL (CAAX protease family)
MDFVHIVAVFPLGLFLGFVSWRSGSIFPAMLGHFVNNVISVIAVVLAPHGETDVLALPIAMVSLSVMGTGIIGLIAVVALSVRYGRPPQDTV